MNEAIMGNVDVISDRYNMLQLFVITWCVMLKSLAKDVSSQCVCSHSRQASKSQRVALTGHPAPAAASADLLSM